MDPLGLLIRRQSNNLSPGAAVSSNQNVGQLVEILVLNTILPGTTFERFYGEAE